MALKPRTLREYFVFLASPGDMQPERRQVREFFDEYNTTTAQHLGLQFRVIDWENYSSAGVGRPQELITAQTLERYRPSLALVIGLMGQRFGMATGKAESGTEEEFLWALQERRRSGWPEVKWFFKQISSLRLPTDPTAAKKALKQWERVLAFKAKVQGAGPNQLYYKEFEEGKFAEVVAFDLRAWLNDPVRPWLAPAPDASNPPPPRRPALLLSAQAFFRRLMDPNRLFSHAWTLVGRETQLDALKGFVATGTARIAIISGRPGMGKSKLLQAFSAHVGERHPERPLGFVHERADLSRATEEDVPTGKAIVVVDDAHRFSDIENILALCLSKPGTQLILATRTYSVDQLRRTSARAGYEQSELLEVEPLRELAKEDVAALARQVLGEEHASLTDEVARATRDCPLITVVAAKLIAEKSVPAALLVNHEDFHHTVMSRFRDELLGDLGGRISSGLAQTLLRMVAATEPITPTDPAYCNAAAAFLELDVPGVIEAFGTLESLGVLLRRGKRVRITPDVLSEYLLREACVSTTGQATGYAERIYDGFWHVCPSELLRNLAEFDWRERKKG